MSAQRTEQPFAAPKIRRLESHVGWVCNLGGMRAGEEGFFWVLEKGLYHLTAPFQML